MLIDAVGSVSNTAASNERDDGIEDEVERTRVYRGHDALRDEEKTLPFAVHESVRIRIYPASNNLMYSPFDTQPPSVNYNLFHTLLQFTLDIVQRFFLWTRKHRSSSVIGEP